VAVGLLLARGMWSEQWYSRPTISSVHSPLQVIEDGDDCTSAGALINILSRPLPEFVLKEPQGL
jgi:hypothetical protein